MNTISHFMSRTVHNGSVKLSTDSFGSKADVPVLLIAGAVASAIFWEDSFCAKKILRYMQQEQNH